jgi:hypothetical protein
MAKTFLKDSTKYLQFNETGTDKIVEAPDETGLVAGIYVVEIDGTPAIDPNDSDKPFTIVKA